METFSAGSCITHGWETFKKRPGFLIGAVLIVFVLSSLVSSINRLTSGGSLAHALLAIVVLLVSFLIDIGLRNFSLKAHDTIQNVSLSDLWHPESYLWYVLAVLLTAVCVIVGLILFIIPGLIVAIMFAFVKLIVVDKGLGPIEAMRESARITKGYRWELFALFLLLILLNILGLVCLIVGLLVTIPITMLSTVHAYRTLENIQGPAQQTV